MRFRSIKLQWFRGAANGIELDLNSRSVAIFGSNGAGKSSFVDGIEAILNQGKIGHLSHEYSGRHQEKGLVNTARPSGQTSRVTITLADGSSEALIWRNASPTRERNGPTALGDWNYRRTVLRQEELSEFIRSTKGDKYSAVLPLLGLDRLESVAENLHKLIKAIERKSELTTLRTKLELATERRKEVFKDLSDQRILERLEELRIAYIADGKRCPPEKMVVSVLEAIDSQISSLNEDQRRSAAIGEIGSSDLLLRLSKVFSAAEKIAELAEPLIQQRLEVLTSAHGFATAAEEKDDTINCPACGRDIETSQFRDHIASERDRLSSVQLLYDKHRTTVSEVCDEVGRLHTAIIKDILIEWQNNLSPELIEGVKYLKDLAITTFRQACGSADITYLQSKVGPLIIRAFQDAKSVPPAVKTLVTHQNEAKAIREAFREKLLQAAILRIDALVDLNKALLVGVREEIAQRARETFEKISYDIERYWKILRPNDAITNVRLIVPKDNDKAVEVALTFHGSDQHSPSLTLSEGQRNALGLCIFLAMANKSAANDTPVILDDVVISFDREHRSRVGALLRQEFATRQIVLLTHDREWYFELQRTLPGKNWGFRRVRPYTNPGEGIRFSEQETDIVAAKDRARTEPEMALGNMRRIMDVALSEIAERINLAVPHLRGDDNDHRTAGQFLVALERAAGKSFRRKIHGDYTPNTAALESIRKAKPELAIWGNRGTHTFSGSSTEALDLIKDCEEVLSHFDCSDCSTPVGAHVNSGGKFECRCGILQWRQ